MTDTTDKWQQRAKELLGIPMPDDAPTASGALRQTMNRSDEVASYTRPPFRKCEFCGCNTNAMVRACCDKGRAADGSTKGRTP